MTSGQPGTPPVERRPLQGYRAAIGSQSVCSSGKAVLSAWGQDKSPLLLCIQVHLHAPTDLLHFNLGSDRQGQIIWEPGCQGLGSKCLARVVCVCVHTRMYVGDVGRSRK